MTALVVQGDARRLPLPDASVDCIITSPPYFALRSYQDGGVHFKGQIGSEPTPAEYLDALWACTAEWMRVLKPEGSIFVNLGDKYAGGGGQWDKDERDNNRRMGGTGNARAAYNGGNTYGLRSKSLLGIPWRYAIGCIDTTRTGYVHVQAVRRIMDEVASGELDIHDAHRFLDELEAQAARGSAGLGLILRAEIIWSKPNGLPESVTDRVRRSHEQFFHFVKQPRYYAAVDEIREAHIVSISTYTGGHAHRKAQAGVNRESNLNGSHPHPLGKLPGSVWSIPSEPLTVPDHLGVDHFAAFPTEWPRRLILGWSPPGVCTACGEGRRPVTTAIGLDMSRPQARRAHALAEQAGLTEAHFGALLSVGVSDVGRGAATQTGTGKNTAEVYALADEARTVLGGYAREYLLRRPTSLSYACACPQPDVPTTPAVILDPFGGTGTTALVAHALGRVGITVDMSGDYSRLAQWRTTDRGELAKAMRVPKPAPVPAGQMEMFA